MSAGPVSAATAEVAEPTLPFGWATRCPRDRCCQDIRSGETLIQEAQAWEERGAIENAYDKFRQGIRLLLEAASQLGADDPPAVSVTEKAATHLTHTEHLRQKFDPLEEVAEVPPPPPKRSRVELGIVPKASFAQGLTGKASSKKMPESNKMASQSLTETSASQSREAHGICPSDRAPAGMPRRFHDHDVMGGVKRPRPQETDPKGQALPALKKQARANTREAAAASSSSAPTAKETESADQRPFVTRAAPVPQSTTLAEPLRYLTEADRITGIADGQHRYFRFAGAQMLSDSDRT